MIRVGVVLVLVAALSAGCGSTRTVTVTTTRTVTASALEPACPSPSFGADGTAHPLFCRVDNPLALRYYPVARALIALGPDATPSAVAKVIEQHRDSLTGPDACNSYELAAWAEHWHFGVIPLGVFSDSC